MISMSFKDLIEFGIKFGEKQRADFIELRYIDAQKETYNFINGEIQSAGSMEPTGIGIRVLIDGSVSFVSTADCSKAGLQKAITSAIKLANVINRTKPIEFSDEEIYQDYWKVETEIPFSTVSPEEKISRFTKIDNELQDTHKEASLPNRNMFLVLQSHKKYIATNEGTRIESDYSIGYLYLIMTAKYVGKTEQRSVGLGQSAGWEYFQSQNFLDAVVEEAKSVQTVVYKAKQKQFDQPIDVIIGSEVAGIIAHENAGHPSEMDRIQGREGAEAGESFWKDIEIGTEQIGSPAVNVIEDPTIPLSSGYYKYDDEGVKARKRYLIKDGVITEPLLNRQFAAQLGTHSNAAARSVGFDREPIIRMANTGFEAGDYTREELFEDIKLGIFMENFTEWNIDDRRFQSKYVGCSARLIKNGVITDEYVRRPILELTSRGLFQSIDAVGKGFEAIHATCGKGNLMQGIPVWAFGPSEGIRMRNIRLGGQ